MSSQWRPLEAGGHSGLSPLGGGQLGGRQVPRQITKNPQNLLQNFHPSQQQSNGYGFNNFPISPPGNSVTSSSGGMMHGSASTSRLSSLMSGGGSGSNFDFGLESSSSSGGGGGGPGGGPGPNYSGSGPHYSGSRSMFSESRSSANNSSNNGFSNMMPSGGGGGFDRSLSNSGYDSHHHSGSGGPGFDRQISVPANLSQAKMHHHMSNGFNSHRSGGDGFNNRGGPSDGFNQHRSGGNGSGDGPGGFNNRSGGNGDGGYNSRSGGNGFGGPSGGGMMGNSGDSFFGGGGGSNMFGRSGSPNQMNGSSRGGPGMNDMKIGTWNDAPAPSNNGAVGNHGGGGGGMNHMNGQPNSGGGGSGGGGGPTFPSVGTFEIGTFNISTNNNSSGRNNTYHNDPTHPPGPGHRETGIIEKLLHSYGFIQCCDRQARLFFHFSQFDGTIEHLKIGDPVEFEMTYDRRTGKPIASQVSKIAPEVVMREERVIGTVTTEARMDPDTGSETHGRISYENRGECFFLPFTTNDVEGNVTVAAGDKVSFQMATMARSGNLVARTIRLENPASPVKYQGVVNSIQEDKTFGFIERADVVREIFFRDSDVEAGQTVDLGDNVEFTIQTRDGKEVACNITKLLLGTVVFEDVGSEYFRGQVLKPLDRNYRGMSEGDALSGRVKYRGPDRSEKEVQFGETDQVGDFTMKHGDWIKFVIAVDRRDKHPRATKIELLDESFKVSDERREQGKVNTIKDAFGFIQCADRDAKIFFPLSECLDVTRQVKENDDCEFTVADDPNQQGKLMATRIKILSPGSVQFSAIIHQDNLGKVESEPSSSREADGSSGTGKILYELNGLNLEIPLHANDCDLRQFPHKGDIVRFDINQLKSTKETSAVNIRIMESQHPQQQQQSAVPVAPAATATVTSASKTSNPPEVGETHQGYIAALKDGFGFIETISHDREIFFHFSNVESKADRLEVGLEVEYTVFNREKGGKVSAENVRLMRRGTIPSLTGTEEVLHGKVVRPLRSVNPDQTDYCGLIQVKNEDGSMITEYRFGIASLINKKELLQIGDAVQFQSELTSNFAVNIHATREKLRSIVEAMKGQYGFLGHEVDEGKKLFFHTSEVENNESLQEGDEVEFVVVTNKRTGKHSACCVRKLSSSKRPERLMSKLKLMNLEDDARAGRKIVVIRQPRGPDGTKGFSAKRAY